MSDPTDPVLPAPDPRFRAADPGVPATLRPGDRVEVQFLKYDGSPHWRYPAAFLGADRYGDWLGGGAGTVIARPGRRFVWDGDFVLLIPRDRHHVVTLNGPTELVSTEFYVDLTTVPTWHAGDSAADPPRVRAVDLDLDVGRRFSQTEPYLDDEDEFAVHRVVFGYPEELVDAVRAEAALLMTQLRAGTEPFGSVAHAWLARVVGREASDRQRSGSGGGPDPGSADHDRG
ncbi:MAG TPA: DUF402 domain-containing protein [Dermatophilaceae bacterium]|nr:DUF402 domain-containing protein [Dermatophilaceae bacterium]